MDFCVLWTLLGMISIDRKYKPRLNISMKSSCTITDNAWILSIIIETNNLKSVCYLMHNISKILVLLIEIRTTHRNETILKVTISPGLLTNRRKCGRQYNHPYEDCIFVKYIVNFQKFSFIRIAKRVYFHELSFNCCCALALKYTFPVMVDLA